MYIQDGVFTTSLRTHDIISQYGTITNLTTTNIYSQILNVINIVVSENIDVDGNLIVDGIVNITNTTN